MSRLLLIRTSSMGDLVHTLPAVTDLSRRFPALAIDWLAEESFVDIAALHPAVDNVIPLAWRRWRRQLWSPATWRVEKRAVCPLGTGYTVGRLRPQQHPRAAGQPVLRQDLFRQPVPVGGDPQPPAVRPGIWLPA